MAKRVRQNRFHIMFTDAEVREIDNWRFKNRIPTRAGAVRLMCATVLRLDTPPKAKALATALAGGPANPAAPSLPRS